MIPKEEIEKEVKKTMDLLKKESSVTTDTFFFTRLQVRIQAAEKNRLSRIFPKPIKVKTIIMAGLITINLLTAVVWTGYNIKSTTRQKLETALSQEYSLTGETGDLLSISVEE